MEYVGAIGACSFNDTAGASSGYLLSIPGYTQTNTDVVINEFSTNTVTPSINSPSNLAAATLWNTPHFLHFVNTSKGAWALTSELMADYDNSKGHSMLLFMRFKCATPPTGADTFFFGNAVGGSDSFGLRVRQSGTAFPVGGDGQMVVATYPTGGGGPYGGQTTVNICDNVEHSICCYISRTDENIYIFVDGVLNSTSTLPTQMKTNTYKTSTHFGIGCNGVNGVLQNALACDIRDIKMVYTPSATKSITEITALVNRMHKQPYYTIKKGDWGY